MFNDVKIGDTLVRIVPPDMGSCAYAQSGKVVEVTETEIVMSILVDQYRIMRFSKKDGSEPSFGSFLIKPQWVL